MEQGQFQVLCLLRSECLENISCDEAGMWKQFMHIKVAAVEEKNAGAARMNGSHTRLSLKDGNLFIEAIMILEHLHINRETCWQIT